ncbi:hypothetical protein AB0B50_24695 [Streptomyces sp. NPDC041068]|uniref:hypothetical protein n=1 Tax=Streptomyces sp. NPDC041068 TaxID=3155130 RepID=UPI003401CC9A
MYEYRNSEFVVSGTEQWVAWPARPRWQLVIRFVLTVLFMPFWIVFGIAVFLGTLAIGLVTEVIAAVSSSYEKAFDEFMDGAMRRITTLPRWCVLWAEMRHEGDADYYRARVDKELARWTERASAPRVPKKPLPPTECEIFRRDYRGCGGHYVVRAAADRGWELRPSTPGESVRLWWSAASAPDHTASS